MTQLAENKQPPPVLIATLCEGLARRHFALASKFNAAAVKFYPLHPVCRKTRNSLKTKRRHPFYPPHFATRVQAGSFNSALMGRMWTLFWIASAKRPLSKPTSISSGADASLSITAGRVATPRKGISCGRVRDAKCSLAPLVQIESKWFRSCTSTFSIVFSSCGPNVISKGCWWGARASCEPISRCATLRCSRSLVCESYEALQTLHVIHAVAGWSMFDPFWLGFVICRSAGIADKPTFSFGSLERLAVYPRASSLESDPANDNQSLG